MNSTTHKFIQALSKRFPLSNRETIEHKRPDLIKSLKSYEKTILEVEEREKIKLPQIVKSLYSYTKNYFIYTDVPVYRQLSLDIINDLNFFKELKQEDETTFAYFTDKKIPFFEADGNYDFLDLTRYNEETDDCPIIYYNHEEPTEEITLFPSVKKFLEVLTIELESGDFYDYRKDGDYERYLDSMKKRGTELLINLLEA